MRSTSSFRILLRDPSRYHDLLQEVNQWTPYSSKLGCFLCYLIERTGNDTRKTEVENMKPGGEDPRYQRRVLTLLTYMEKPRLDFCTAPATNVYVCLGISQP